MKKTISIIIPTYGRDKDVIIRTLRSLIDLQNEFIDLCHEVILSDQNSPSLDLMDFFNSLDPLKYTYIKHQKDSSVLIDDSLKLRFIHITGQSLPSVTIAKNYAVKISKGEHLVFFDDDVIVSKNCLLEHQHALFQIKNVGALGGRETVHPKSANRSWFKSLLLRIYELGVSDSASENQYKLNGIYIGRIFDNSFMINNFDQVGLSPVLVDGVRGCNWAVKKEVFLQAQGFDEYFQKTALREETDLYLRIKKLGYKNYYIPTAHVDHMRGLGGCNNLAKNISSLESKFECELYFQQKHFPKVHSVFFLLRMLPMTLEMMMKTYGYSAWLLLRSTIYLVVRKYK